MEAEWPSHVGRMCNGTCVQGY